MWMADAHVEQGCRCPRRSGSRASACGRGFVGGQVCQTRPDCHHLPRLPPHGHRQHHWTQDQVSDEGDRHSDDDKRCRQGTSHGCGGLADRGGQAAQEQRETGAVAVAPAGPVPLRVDVCGTRAPRTRQRRHRCSTSGGSNHRTGGTSPACGGRSARAAVVRAGVGRPGAQVNVGKLRHAPQAAVCTTGALGRVRPSESHCVCVCAWCACRWKEAGPTMARVGRWRRREQLAVESDRGFLGARHIRFCCAQGLRCALLARGRSPHVRCQKM